MEYIYLLYMRIISIDNNTIIICFMSISSNICHFQMIIDQRQEQSILYGVNLTPKRAKMRPTPIPIIHNGNFVSDFVCQILCICIDQNEYETFYS